MCSHYVEVDSPEDLAQCQPFFVSLPMSVVWTEEMAPDLSL